MTDWLARLDNTANQATPGGWEKCGANDGACQCGLIHSIPSDAVLAIVQHKTEDGEWTEEAFQANKDFIARFDPDTVKLMNAALAEYAELLRQRGWTSEVLDALAEHVRREP